MEGNSKLAPSPVRLPLDLKTWLKHRAVDNRRSMNSEIVHRLDASRTAELLATKGEGLNRANGSSPL